MISTVIFSVRICKRESIGMEEKKLILGFLKKGIYQIIKGESLPIGNRLIKIYATTINGARRVVFMHDKQKNVFYFLFYRSKNDSLGKNISIKNPQFKAELK